MFNASVKEVPVCNADRAEKKTMLVLLKQKVENWQNAQSFWPSTSIVTYGVTSVYRVVHAIDAAYF